MSTSCILRPTTTDVPATAATWKGDILRGVRGRDSPKVHWRPLSQEGGAEGSQEPDLGEARCQVITALVQPDLVPDT